MTQILGYTIWILLAATLPLSIYLYVRSKNKLALIMVAGAVLIWGGAIAGFLAEPEVIRLSGPNDAVQSHMVVRGSELGGNVALIGATIFLLGAIATAVGSRRSKGNAV